MQDLQVLTRISVTASFILLQRGLTAIYTPHFGVVARGTIRREMEGQKLESTL